MNFASKSAGRSTSGADPAAEDGVERKVVGQQADRPCADRLVLVVEQTAEEGVGRGRRSRKSDQSARSL